MKLRWFPFALPPRSFVFLIVMAQYDSLCIMGPSIGGAKGIFVARLGTSKGPFRYQNCSALIVSVRLLLSRRSWF